MAPSGGSSNDSPTTTSVGKGRGGLATTSGSTAASGSFGLLLATRLAHEVLFSAQVMVFFDPSTSAFNPAGSEMSTGASAQSMATSTDCMGV